MPKRSHTTVSGAASPTAILVAMNEAPHTTTAKSTARIAPVRDSGWESVMRTGILPRPLLPQDLRRLAMPAALRLCERGGEIVDARAGLGVGSVLQEQLHRPHVVARRRVVQGRPVVQPALPDVGPG